ncbi:MAG: hypothetical protein EBV06_14325 [Planctomycetia bacterium]|nr:hypothetical protein [Planctomycetia bacterium]
MQSPIVLVCLGGYDLEMLTIGALLRPLPNVELCDHHLAWGARASAYRDELWTASQHQRPVVLIELQDDLPAELPRASFVWIDHHGDRAGCGRPTALEQVFATFSFPASAWTRDLALVAANDRGHIAAMLELNATLEELQDIRRRDRAAQGITPEEEAQGRVACLRAKPVFGGRLTLVELPHTRAATVTDSLDDRLGGPGYQNLLILAPTQTMFFGAGDCIEALKRAHPASWFGGELPLRGYWGCAERLDPAQLINSLEPYLS